MMMIGNVMGSDAHLQQNLREPQASLDGIVSALNQSRAMADHASGPARGFSSNGLHNKPKRPSYGKIGVNQQLGFVAERVDWVSGCEGSAETLARVSQKGSFSVGRSQSQMEISGYDKAVQCSLKIQVIDETALLETVSVPKSGNGRGKEAKQSRGKGKGARKAFDLNTRQKSLRYPNTKVPKAQRTKRVYSREEMEALRFVQLLDQRKLWKAIYIGLGPSVAREYDDLAYVRHQKQVPHFDPRLQQRYGKNPSPGILGVATRGRGYHANIFVH